MTISLDRRLENAHITRNIEIAECVLDVPLDFTWISDLNSNKKIEIRRITANIDSEGGYTFSLKIGYSNKQVACITSIISLLMLI
jgi:hypothetical protein